MYIYGNINRIRNREVTKIVLLKIKVNEYKANII